MSTIETSDNKNSLRVFAIWNRKHERQGSGRAKSVAEIRMVLNRYHLKDCVVSNYIERGYLAGLMHMACGLLSHALSGDPLPLQVLLYANRKEISRICAEIEQAEPDVIFVDTVRLLLFAREIRKRWPRIRVVLDMDDLFSARYERFAALGVSLNVGYLESRLPRRVVKLFASSRLARWLYRREASRLVAVEDECASLADAIVLVSVSEAKKLGSRIGAAAREHIHALMPPPSVVKDKLIQISPPFHFVFIGTDRLEQNASTIAYLLELWRRRAIGSRLIIYGEMVRRWDPPNGVVFAGFAHNLSEVYMPGAILAAPSFIKGGVKTKVVEAFGFGAPVIGTATTFDGIIQDYPLRFSDAAELEDCIVRIDQFADAVRDAQKIGYHFAVEHGQDAYTQKWDAIVTGPKDAESSRGSSWPT